MKKLFELILEYGNEKEKQYYYGNLVAKEQAKRNSEKILKQIKKTIDKKKV